MSNILCEGCGKPLTDYGHLGLSCADKDCTYEMDMITEIFRKQKEQKEREELMRLKAKYEGYGE